MPNELTRQPAPAWPWWASVAALWLGLSGCQVLITADEGFNVSVRESTVYTTTDARNGAGPLWNFSSTNIARTGDTVWVSGLRTVPGLPPLNNTECTLWKQTGAAAWTQVATLPGLTREPCPIGVLNGQRLVISTNPTLNPPGKPGGGPARPGLWEYDPTHPDQPPVITEPRWRAGAPVDKFAEHSYRSLAVDGARGEIFLMQNIGYTHAEWTFRDSRGEWSSQGKLDWPVKRIGGKDVQLRVCYTVALVHDRAVYLLGVSDVVEPNAEWRDYKRKLTGKEWDYVFRNLYYTWTPDITSVPFQPWLEVASREETAGRIVPGDLWLAPDGTVHAVWEETAIDDRLRAAYFPNKSQQRSILHALIVNGEVVGPSELSVKSPGSREVAHWPRIHVAQDGGLLVLVYVDGVESNGAKVSKNMIIKLKNGHQIKAVDIPADHPSNQYVTTTPRAGGSSGNTLDVLGFMPENLQILRYIEVNIQSP